MSEESGSGIAGNALFEWDGNRVRMVMLGPKVRGAQIDGKRPDTLFAVGRGDRTDAGRDIPVALAQIRNEEARRARLPRGNRRRNGMSQGAAAPARDAPRWQQDRNKAQVQEQQSQRLRSTQLTRRRPVEMLSAPRWQSASC